MLTEANARQRYFTLSRAVSEAEAVSRNRLGTAEGFAPSRLYWLTTRAFERMMMLRGIPVAIKVQPTELTADPEFAS